MWPCSWFEKRFKQKRIAMYKRFRNWDPDPDFEEEQKEEKEDFIKKGYIPDLGSPQQKAKAVETMRFSTARSNISNTPKEEYKTDDSLVGAGLLAAAALSQIQEDSWASHSAGLSASDFSDTESVEEISLEDVSLDPEPEQGGYDYEEQGGYEDSSSDYDSGSTDYDYGGDDWS